MEEIEEQEDDYVNASKGAVDEKRTRPGRRFVLPIAVCWLILLAIMGLRIYLTSELSGNNAELYSRIQELETNWNELNVSRAQWSINEYCKQGEVKQCRPCEKNWRYHEPSCYSFNDVGPTERLTWEEAREYCRALNADLFAAHNGREMQIIYKYSKGSYGIDGSWIGLRVENGKWKWADGSDLTDSSWVDPPTEGHCALSFWYRTPWSSVSCEEKQRWICQKKALSV
ncbi:hypothetical protein NQZ68_020105 [Dissostichus eleginoides]|nr:hypothetical protein NQZ68_020105 [Dissostichus eleginoides]